MEQDRPSLAPQQLRTITDHFRDHNLQQRFVSELALLRQRTPQVTVRVFFKFDKLFFEIYLDSHPYSFKLYNEQILFHIVCKKSYPLTPVRVYLRTGLFQPYINDCRDLLSEITNHNQWHHSTHIYQIVQSIPAFLHRLVSYAEDPLVIQKIGVFHTGEVYHIEETQLFKPLETYQVFTLQGDRISMSCLGLTDTHILILLPDKQPDFQGQKLRVPDFQLLGLQRYLEIRAIHDIKINKQDSEIVVTFKSYKQKKTVLEPFMFKINVRVVNLKGFLRKLLKSVNKFHDVTLDYEVGKCPDEEMQELLREVKAAEANLAHYLNKESIGELNRCYQNVVEYLSGIDNPIYLIYLNKIAGLFLREDVKLVSEIKI